MMTKLVTRVAQAALLTTTAVAPVALVVPATPAVASPAQDYCEDVLGGVYSKSNGQITCTVSVISWTSGKDGKGQMIDNEVFVYTNGTWNNDPQSGGSKSCDGPGSSGDSSDHCK